MAEKQTCCKTRMSLLWYGGKTSRVAVVSSWYDTCNAQRSHKSALPLVLASKCPADGIVFMFSCNCKVLHIKPEQCERIWPSHGLKERHPKHPMIPHYSHNHHYHVHTNIHTYIHTHTHTHTHHREHTTEKERERERERERKRELTLRKTHLPCASISIPA